jgi:hypothetical protein
MPRLVSYPRSSLKKSLDLAKAVDDLGGSCNLGTCADKMGMKVSGGFTSIIGGAVKFGLITYKRDTLATTELYKSIKHSYDENEKMKYLREALFKPPLFNELYDRFKNRELPTNMLDKVLIREFKVDERAASRVAKYFIDGVKYISLLDNNNKLMSISKDESVEVQKSRDEQVGAESIVEDEEDTEERATGQFDEEVPNNFTRIETEFFTLTIEKSPETWDLLEKMLPIYKKRLKIEKHEDDDMAV